MIMKKIITCALTMVMALSLLAGCASSGANESVPTQPPVYGEDTMPTFTAPVLGGETEPAGDASAVAVLENIWAKYGDDEKFAVIGGNMENPVDGAPGNYDMAYAENLTYNLLVPAEQLTNVAEAATMIHMMNANTFTSGVVHLADGVDAAAFAAAMRDAIQGNQWMCGFPETLVIASIGDYVLIAFGVNDAMNPFQTHLAEAYPDAVSLYNEAITG
jgi:hypothetical protein